MAKVKKLTISNTDKNVEQLGFTYNADRSEIQ